MRKILAAMFSLLILFCMAGAAAAQNATSGLNTNPMTAKTASSSLDYDTGERARYCNNKYEREHIPASQHADFINQCMQVRTITTGPVTPLELVAQNEKSKSCKQSAQGQYLTGTARNSFLQDCMNK